MALCLQSSGGIRQFCGSHVSASAITDCRHSRRVLLRLILALLVKLASVSGVGDSVRVNDSELDERWYSGSSQGFGLEAGDGERNMRWPLWDTPPPPNSLLLPDFSTRFLQQLYATYLSYAEPAAAAYSLQARHDARGSLAEFIKSEAAGQIFVSRTRPGVTRGNHYHHTKTEKFLVLEGEGRIELRHIDDSTKFEFRVSGTEYRVVDIPPGYTHSITNVGDGEMVTLFWASEIFDPDKPDTFSHPVKPHSVSQEMKQEHAA